MKQVKWKCFSLLKRQTFVQLENFQKKKKSNEPNCEKKGIYLMYVLLEN